jgi:outer membrane protein assembly factor BamE
LVIASRSLGPQGEPLESIIISRSAARGAAAAYMTPTRTSTIARTAWPLPRAARLAAAGAVLAALSACTAIGGSGWTNVFLPHRTEVVQGNVVTSEQVVRVSEGMSRVQVREVLGTPLLADLFHADRWDYVFLLNRPGRPNILVKVTVLFEGDKVKRIEAPPLPTDAEFIDSIDPLRSRRAVPVLALTPEQVKALPLPPPAAAANAASAVPTGPQRNYPPLEPRA